MTSDFNFEALANLHTYFEKWSLNSISDIDDNQAIFITFLNRIWTK